METSKVKVDEEKKTTDDELLVRTKEFIPKREVTIYKVTEKLEKRDGT